MLEGVFHHRTYDYERSDSRIVGEMLMCYAGARRESRRKRGRNNNTSSVHAHSHRERERERERKREREKGYLKCWPRLLVCSDGSQTASPCLLRLPDIPATSGAEQSREEQSKAEQSRAEQRREGQAKGKTRVRQGRESIQTSPLNHVYSRMSLMSPKT